MTNISNPIKNPFVPENLAQAINPWSWWFEGNANQNQNGFINVTTYKSGNPKLEQKIVGEVAGYGMQLGIIEDIIEMMIGFLPKSQLTAEQVKIIERFRGMVEQIRAQKENDFAERYSMSSIDTFVEGLAELKNKDKVLYERITARLKEGLK